MNNTSGDYIGGEVDTWDTLTNVTQLWGGRGLAQVGHPPRRFVALNESGTQRIGQDHARAKLSNAQVEAIRDEHEAYPLGDPRHVGYKRLAEKWRVSKRTIRDTIDEWQNRYPAFSDQVACARAGCARRHRRGREIADETAGNVNRDKAITDLDLKLLSNRAARCYGDKQFLEHSGNLMLMFADLNDDELVDRILELQATGRDKSPASAVLERLDTKALQAPEPAEGRSKRHA